MKAMPAIGFNPRPRRGAGATSNDFYGFWVEICFNPRPRRGAGATPKNQTSAKLSTVSILARAEARALPPKPPLVMKSGIGFNPRPRRGAGATSPGGITS